MPGLEGLFAKLELILNEGAEAAFPNTGTAPVPVRGFFCCSGVVSESSGGSAANRLPWDDFRSIFSLLGWEGLLAVSNVDQSPFSEDLFSGDGFEEIDSADGEGLNEVTGGVLTIDATGM